MRKKYTKPEIMFENFAMSTNIAGDCEGEPVNNATKGSCGIPGSGGDFLFTDGVEGCTIDWKALNGADNYNGLCYHHPTSDSNLFNS